MTHSMAHSTAKRASQEQTDFLYVSDPWRIASKRPKQEQDDNTWRQGFSYNKSQPKSHSWHKRQRESDTDWWSSSDGKPKWWQHPAHPHPRPNKFSEVLATYQHVLKAICSKTRIHHQGLRDGLMCLRRMDVQGAQSTQAKKLLKKIVCLETATKLVWHHNESYPAQFASELNEFMDGISVDGSRTHDNSAICKTEFSSSPPDCDPLNDESDGLVLHDEPTQCSEVITPSCKFRKVTDSHGQVKSEPSFMAPDSFLAQLQSSQIHCGEDISKLPSQGLPSATDINTNCGDEDVSNLSINECARLDSLLLPVDRREDIYDHKFHLFVKSLAVDDGKSSPMSWTTQQTRQVRDIIRSCKDFTLNGHMIRIWDRVFSSGDPSCVSPPMLRAYLLMVQQILQERMRTKSCETGEF